MARMETVIPNSDNSVAVNEMSSMQQALSILQEIYGYADFRLNQAQIIAALLDGEDVMALMPTGGGKSLCYQIPSLVRAGVGVVISPLIALMQDQVDALQQLGIRAAFLNSTLSGQQINQTQKALLNGELDLLYIAPERLLTETCLNLLGQVTIALFAIDEAHCVSQWGHDFRKEYQQLSVLVQRFPGVPRIALTATADTRTRQEIIEQLYLQQARVFVNSFDRPNIHYAINDGQNPRDQLWRFIKREHPDDAGIVYCLSRKKVESVAQWLTQKGREALPYHAGLSDEVRRRHQERFLREEGLIVVATIAFGMGIDKPDVRFVAHLSLPKSIEAYYQETGRAGRDGEPANAWMCYGLQEVITLRQMMQESDAPEQQKRISHNKLEAMLGLSELIGCRRQALLAYFSEQQNEPCGNCDNCRQPPKTWDATVDVQKALSCVYRTGQRFGVNYIIDVLQGVENARIQSYGHDKLSTFGIGTELSATQWRSVFRQLIVLSYLQVDHERHGALRLTDKCRSVLKGGERLQLRELQCETVAEPKSAKSTEEQLRPWERELYQQLRELRRQLAEQQQVPAYVIFHDKTLYEMARVRPVTMEQLRYIPGVGEKKAQRYGNDFFCVIKRQNVPEILNNRLGDTVNETLYLFSQQMDVAQIAAGRGLSEGTVYEHFVQAIEAGVVDADDVLGLDQAQYDELFAAIETFYDEDQRRIKPVYEALNGQYQYGQIKCLLASLDFAV